MASRGGGRGRGRGNVGGFSRAKELPFELFPEVESIGPVKYSKDEVRKYSQFASWSQNLQSFFETSPYHYEDASLTLAKVQKLDIERYSDKKTQTTTVKQQLSDFINMGKDHMPTELAGDGKRIAKKVKWDNEIDLNKLDQFEKLEDKLKGKEGDNEEEEEEEEEENEEEGELSDEGDYEQGEYCDDDEDDFNMVEEDDGPIY